MLGTDSKGLGWLGSNSKGLGKLRLVCKGFQDALRTIPLHVTAGTVHQVRSLPLLHDWDIAAVQLHSSTGTTSEPLIKAACALPEGERNKVVTIGVPGKRVANLTPWLRRLNGVRHIVVKGRTTRLECLSHLEHLGLAGQPECADMLVLLPPCMHLPCIHAACRVWSFMLHVRSAAWTNSNSAILSHAVVQERISTFANLQSLHISADPKSHFGYWLPSYAVAQCPALKVLELSNKVSLDSPGTFEEAVERLEDSSLQVLKIHTEISELSTVRDSNGVLPRMVLTALCLSRCMPCGKHANRIKSIQSFSGQVWMVQKPRVGGAGLLDSVLLRKCFSCSLEEVLQLQPGGIQP